MECEPIDVQTADMTLPGRLYAAPDARATLVLAHGAGAGQAHPWMRARAADLQARGLSVVTFDFPYMSQGRKLPDRAPVLLAAFAAVVAAIADRLGTPIVIGGKSMGGRMATMLAAEDGLHPSVVGVVAMGYPLHPPGRPDKLRVEHLPRVAVPLLVVQGTRDPFGSPDEIAAECARVGASPTVVPVAEGGHGFEVPKRVGPQAQVFAEVTEVVTSWLDTLLSTRAK